MTTWPLGTDRRRPAHKCELCYKTFATDARLKKHMAVYAGDETKPLECRTCGKRFLTNAALASHIKTRNNPDTFFFTALSAGKNLDKLPSWRSMCMSIKKEHKEGDNFACPHCQKTFAKHHNIRKHIRSFHAEKRFLATFAARASQEETNWKIIWMGSHT